VLWNGLLAIGAVVSFALGWPRDALARDQSSRSGLLWGALTFVLPFTVGFMVGWVAEDQNKTSEVAFGLGFVLGAASSSIAVVLGTLTAHAARRRRQFRRHS
jgi:hypothetical protein